MRTPGSMWALQFGTFFGCALALQAAGPGYGLDTLPARPLVFGYLNDLRTTNPPAAEIARLDFDAVDVVVQGFAEPMLDGSLGFGLGKLALYRPMLLAEAHGRGKGVILSIGGGAPERLRNSFAAIAAHPLRRKSFAAQVVRTLQTWGYDGVDIDYEFPSTLKEKKEFTALMQAVHAAVKGAHSNYVVMFGASPGFYIDQMEWSRLAGCADFAFYFGYDWKNPANGPMTNPQVVQWLSGGFEKIEASTRGALHYMVAHGFPPQKIIFGLPFFSSANDTWPVLRETWATNRNWFSNTLDVTTGEVPFAGRWWTTPESVERKMSSVLDPQSSVLTNRMVLRGVGFWEFGHQEVMKPDLTRAIKGWLTSHTNDSIAVGKK